MALLHRSYGGKLFRPKPFVYEEENLLVIATCWGAGDQTVHVVDEVVKYVNAASGDVEVTSPFEFVSSLSDQANSLRVACLLANDLVHRGENRTEYTSGYEILAISHGKGQLTWAQIGGPHILFKKKNMTLQSVAGQQDLSYELSHKQMLPPMPARLMGLENSAQVYCGDIKYEAGDQIVLASAALVPEGLWTQSGAEKMRLDKVTQWMVQENPDMPFWLGNFRFSVLTFRTLRAFAVTI